MFRKKPTAQEVPTQGECAGCGHIVAMTRLKEIKKHYPYSLYADVRHELYCQQCAPPYDEVEQACGLPALYYRKIDFGRYLVDAQGNLVGRCLLCKREPSKSKRPAGL